jgi:type IV secretory pathway TraG/TraD family ATPase VirD4
MNNPINKLGKGLFESKVLIKEIRNQIILLLIVSTTVFSIWLVHQYFQLSLSDQKHTSFIFKEYLGALLNISQPMTHIYFKEISIFSDLYKPLTVSLFIWGLLAFALYKIGENQKNYKIIEGVQLLKSKQYKKHLGKNKSDISIGNIQWFKNAEVQHLLVVGDPGTGKSQFHNQLFEHIRKRGDIAIIYDLKGDFIRYHGNKEIDLIQSAFDDRSLAWDVFDDLKTDLDYKAFASAIIKENSQQDPFWTKAAQMVLVEGLRKGKSENWSFSETINFLTKSNFEILSKWLENTKAISIFSNEKTASSVMTQLINDIDCLNYLKPVSGTKHNFSVNSWLDTQLKKVNNNEQAGWMFLPVIEKYKTVGTPIVAAILEVLANKILSMETDSKRRIWIIVDELPSLPRLTVLQRLLAQGRGYGVAGVLSIQNLSQLKVTYGADDAQALTGLCSSILSLRVSDPETAHYISRRMGKQIRKEIQNSQSHSKNHNKKGLSEGQSEHIVERPVVSETVIMTFDDLNGVLLSKGVSNPVLVKIEVQILEPINQPFIEAHDLHARNQSYPTKKPDGENKPSKWEV